MTVGEQAACRAHAGFHPLSPTFLADPFAVMRSVPREAPVFYAPSINYYVITRYADIEAIFPDDETYTTAPAQLPLVALVPQAGADRRRTQAAAEEGQSRSAGPYTSPFRRLRGRSHRDAWRLNDASDLARRSRRMILLAPARRGGTLTPRP
jgi:hypothetical protein